MARIKSSEIEVEAATKGAELQSIRRGGIEYLWQGDPAFWPRRSPLLFPIVGALPGGGYGYAGRTYAMGNHGFVRDLEFRLASRGSGSLRFELAGDEATLSIYPFKFELAVAYEVEGDSLEVGYEVVNADDKPMPFSIGAHPAFRAPLVPGERREDFDLIFERPETVDRYYLNSDNLRTGEKESFLRGASSVPVSPSLFEKGAIVLKDHASRTATMKSRVSGRFVELGFPGFPALGIWSPKGDCPFVCIEPWHGVMALAGSTHELERKEAVIILEPGAVFRSAYTIRVG